MRERGKEREKEREREPTLKKEEEKDRSESEIEPTRSISTYPATVLHRSTSIPHSYSPPQFPMLISPSSQVSLPSNSAIFAQNCLQLSFPSSSLTSFASLSPFSSSSIAPQIFDKALSGATSSISPSSSSSSSNHHLPQQRQQQHLQQTAVFQSLPSDSQPDLSAEKSSEFD
ncbi:uncharacterized protein MONOS_5548 [Monocercomonoides exilis]|uniref:uncharacterized protein n=1 Tax=Monocercomonoides exilis TaxID=2049356 RepID=UPI00355A0798|nr:hypothetical protein MONOS_5548 [Monocercomonoides exilis]|eukprot:MONOS_5548.1-p1 / transcript=MONOS_5548.1 / gene=MONOS_5548 / organism=Monocercomonoides_exilis_PA203 / gene_product=unspecified product / transcript_product=unspecified product / location=Mono_scaffold00163:10061-10743(-) / protein_length=172 / sequence_SO=supercontig / SO=protein_coding / is_pseudo=false